MIRTIRRTNRGGNAVCAVRFVGQRPARHVCGLAARIGADIERLLADRDTCRIEVRAATTRPCRGELRDLNRLHPKVTP